MTWRESGTTDKESFENRKDDTSWHKTGERIVLA